MKKGKTQVKNIWMLSREYGDIAGAGGVKDVSAQLSQALARWTGRKVHVVLPLYGFIDIEKMGIEQLTDPDDPHKALQFFVEMNYTDVERKESVSVWKLRESRVDVFFLDSPRFREKQNIYTYTAEEEGVDPQKRRGEGHFDYFAMNLLLQKAAIQLLILLEEKPDIIHCHDGHTAVLPAIIAEIPWLRNYFRRTGCLVTIHNAGQGYHQEVSDLPYAQAMTGLPWRVINRCRLQHSFDPLVAAGLYGIVNTVSENYARELQETFEDERTGWLGHHLLDLGVTLEGTTNGVDPLIYDPRRDDVLGLAADFDPRDDTRMRGKQKCRDHLLDSLGRSVQYGDNEYDGIERYGYLEADMGVPLFTFIGRLSEQKGVDILLESVYRLLDDGFEFRLVVLGNGNIFLENELAKLALYEKSEGKICFLRGFDYAMANRIYGGGDFFIVPSRYEPCGLTDFIAQLFGTIPIVNSIGGLVKVRDGVTGLSYLGNTSENLAQTMKRAADLFCNKDGMRNIQKQAVELIDRQYTWNVVMKNYLSLYEKAISSSRERQNKPL